MATKRIDEGLAAVQRAGFPLLKRQVEQKLVERGFVKGRKTKLDGELSLGGFRGVVSAVKSSKETERRKLARGTIVASHVLGGTAVGTLKSRYKNKSTPELKALLRDLDTASGDAREGVASTAMRTGMAKGKAYRYLVQQTQTDSATTDARLALIRGWVPETKAGVPTGRYVPVDGGDSCGPTALAIAYYYLKGHELKQNRLDNHKSEAQLREMSARDGEGWQKAGVGTGTKTMQTLVRTGRQMGLTCGNASNRGAGLRDWLVKNVDKDQRRVAIVNVGWHFSVAVKIDDGSLICADPWFGIVETPIDQVPEYNAKGKRLDGWAFKIS